MEPWCSEEVKSYLLSDYEPYFDITTGQLVVVKKKSEHSPGMRVGLEV